MRGMSDAFAAACCKAFWASDKPCLQSDYIQEEDNKQ